jgi:uncharacterized protein
MPPSATAAPGHFCWLDLAARDAGRAASFYSALFGWTAVEQRIGPGTLTRLSRMGQDVGSLYQLSRQQLGHGAPSHWTPYVAVRDLEEAIASAAALGGRVIVTAFEMPGMARVGLVMDPVGAMIGLWENAAGRSASLAPGRETQP